MRRIILVIAGGFLALLLILVVVGLFLPTEWDVTQSIVIKAGPAKIHPLVSDFRQWQDWAHWNKEADPTLKFETEGAEQGVGAVHRWNGENTGRGRLEITKSDPESGIEYEGRIETDEVNAHGSITYEIVKEGTRVVWHDTGDVGMKPFGGYVVGSLEGVLGQHFGRALEELKQRVEAPPR